MAAVLIILCAAIGLAVSATVRANAARPSSPPPAYVKIERAGLRYEFDALTGRQRLVELSRPSLDLIGLRPEAARELRTLLERELGTSLDELREFHRESAEALRRLGYL